MEDGNRCTALVKGCKEFCNKKATMVVVYNSPLSLQVNTLHLCSGCYKREDVNGLFKNGHKVIYYKDVKKA